MLHDVMGSSSDQTMSWMTEEFRFDTSQEQTCLLQCVHASSRIYPAFQPMPIKGSFFRGKVKGQE